MLLNIYNFLNVSFMELIYNLYFVTINTTDNYLTLCLYNISSDPLLENKFTAFLSIESSG